MKLIRIKTSRYPSRVNLIFDNGRYLPFFIDDLYKNHLVSGMDIKDKQFLHLIGLSVSYLLKDYSLRQIAISPKIEIILKPKLNQKLRFIIKKFKLENYNVALKEIVKISLTYLHDRNLLSVSEYSNYLIKKFHHKPSGYIRSKLTMLGLKEGVDFNLPQTDDEISKIIYLLSRKNIPPESLSDWKQKNRLTAMLYRRGYNLDDIRTAFDDYLTKR